ncbi:site-specific integrase [Rhodococcus triatomae]|uniref:Phage integrase family protein n=1 Tax=Rhodococcus triatomae TaxID=300028 RepID=A0A1G8H4B4_9NOCA|nr:site-specific integrase [Rhodococcus triatomae]QNG20214.1 site-specific integrase [Rhodococcus triatomae]QNG23871.1 site-specific integrase [Rhodococcus triatomae]SDI01350.1 Phage integrase family protein [Rhodococcus triatomae]
MPDGSRHGAPTTFDTRKQAEDWLSSVRVDILRGVWVDPTASAVTFGDYARDWFDSRQLAPRTRDLYDGLLRRWVETELPASRGALTLADVEVGKITTAVIRRWHAAVVDAAAASAATTGPVDRRNPARVWAESDAGRQLLTTGGIPAPKRSGRLSPAVIDAYRAAGSPPIPRSTPRGDGRTQAAQAYRVVRAILTTAVDDRLLPSNPCRLPGAGTTRPAERPIVGRADVHALADAMPPYLAASVFVATWSGLRASELFALDRSRVDLDAGCLRVDRSQIVLRGRFVGYGPPKSDAGRRTVHLPAFVVAVLREHIDTHTGPGPDALVFARPDTGGPVVDSIRNRAFGKARKAIGRPDLRWHDLRHTGATMAARAGATPRELQHRLGHATGAAAAIYQHRDDARDAELARRMAG